MVQISVQDPQRERETLSVSEREREKSNGFCSSDLQFSPCCFNTTFKAVFLLKINNNWTFHIDVKLHFIYKYFILYFYFLFLQIHL